MYPRVYGSNTKTTFYRASIKSRGEPTHRSCGSTPTTPAVSLSFPANEKIPKKK
jgi:hypothetical protein